MQLSATLRDAAAALSDQRTENRRTCSCRCSPGMQQQLAGDARRRRRRLTGMQLAEARCRRNRSLAQKTLPLKESFAGVVIAQGCSSASSIAQQEAERSRFVVEQEARAAIIRAEGESEAARLNSSSDQFADGGGRRRHSINPILCT